MYSRFGVDVASQGTDPIELYLILAGAAAAGLVIAIRWFRTRHDGPLRALAAALGMEWIPADIFGTGAGFSGTLDGAQINAARSAGLFVEIVAPFPADFRVNSRTLERIRTGDIAFDKRLSLDGSSSTIAAIMDGPSRATLMALSRKANIDLEAGRLTLSIFDLGDLESTIRTAVAWGKSIGGVTISARGLAERARTEDLPRLREMALEALLAAFPDAPESGAVAAELSRSADARTALLARLLDPASAAALVASPSETAEALTTLSHEAARAGLRLLARRCGGAEALLIETLRAAARTGGRVLEADAASELAKSGTAACVALLKELRAARVGEPEARQAIDGALSAVQARLLGEHGDLAIADAERGQVSLASAQQGAISIADGKKG